MKLKETKSRPQSESCGKFQTKGIKVVGKWKQVKIDPSVFADGQMDDLVCFEELTDYRLVSPARNPSSLFSKEEPKKRKAQAVSEGQGEGECSSSKKKMKLKKRKDADTEGPSAQKEFQVKDVEPEPQGDGTVCPDSEVGEAAPGSLALTVPKKKKKKGKKPPEPSQAPTAKEAKRAKTWVPEVHDQKADVSAWKDLFVPKPVLRALSFLGFTAPTPIQALTLAPAIRDKLDILGAAETGEAPFSGQGKVASGFSLWLLTAWATGGGAAGSRTTKAVVSGGVEKSARSGLQSASSDWCPQQVTSSL